MIGVVAQFGHFLRKTFHCIVELLSDGLGLVVRMVRSRAAVSAEILFVRKQLAFYREQQAQPRRLTDAARIGLVFWSQWFDWRGVLMIIQRETLIGWHRKGFKLFWHRLWYIETHSPHLHSNALHFLREIPLQWQLQGGLGQRPSISLEIHYSVA
jgi:hypothetical protein